MFSILKRNMSTKEQSRITKGMTGLPEEQRHFVFKRPMSGPFPEYFNKLIVGMGCFWGVEKMFWKTNGVYMTAAGYSGGSLPNPSYEEVCSLNTGHNEVVLVHYDPRQIDVRALLKIFWEGHNPTQGMRQGNDIGSQYRSGIYAFEEKDLKIAIESKAEYQEKLLAAGYGQITTEIVPAQKFYYAEIYHQQYLAKNSNGYCGLGGTGVSFS